MSKRFTEGIAFDGTAILDNCQPMTITEILNNLNRLDSGDLELKKLYSEIEYLIIMWSNTGTKTAGSLTREIMDLLIKKDLNSCRY